MAQRHSLLLRPPCAIVFFLAISTAIAQGPAAKRAIKHSDYEIWNNSSTPNLTRDGTWLGYTLLPAEGDGAIVLRSLVSATEHRIATGGRPSSESSETPGASTTPAIGGAVSLSSPQFTPDSKRAIFKLTPTKAEVEKQRAEKKSTSQPARSTVAIVDLASGSITDRLNRVASFAIVGEGSGMLVYRKEAAVERPPTTVGAVAGASAVVPMSPPATTPTPQTPPSPPGARQTFGQRPGTTAPTSGSTPTPRTTYGTELVIRKLADGTERSFQDVTEYSITKDAKLLVYGVASKKDETNGVYVVDLDSQAGPFPVRAGKGRYTRLVWDENQTRLAFFYDDTPAAASSTPAQSSTTPAASTATPAVSRAPAKLRVFLWERAEKAQVASAIKSAGAKTRFREAIELLGPTPAGIRSGWTISDRGSFGFSEDGKKLALAVIQLPKETASATRSTTSASDRVELDIWHWKDELIQPMQKVRGSSGERTRSYNAVYFLDTKEFRQIADENQNALVPGHGDWTVVSNDKPYRYLTGYGASLNDHSLMNIRTGEIKSILKAATGGMLTSPKGSYTVHFDGKDWNSIAIPSGLKRNLTEKLPVKFFDEEHDTPNEAPSYGVVGWTSDAKAILVNDKYDIWKLAVDGSSATNITSIGRDMKTELRFVRLRSDEEPTERGIDLSKPHILAATNTSNYDTGYYRLEPTGKPKLLVMGARKYDRLAKASKADTYVFTISTFFNAPDYYVTGADFREIRKITNLQPRKSEFLWGKAELVHYKSLEGQKLSGILIKPEDFDANKKYPMIVYIYERLSQGLHQFRLPSAGTSINPTYYASNGYLVFMPDIAYTVGSPGQSAMKCVLPAIQAVVDQGCVDEKAIGIQGHSWGGYQISYMVTQTNRFKAAAAGAPVSNMVSAYGGIRWGTGLPRQFQYERTQSRIGAKLWDAPFKFIENSPIFMADRVQTPLMILHNDQDDAVPWYQGIEYYLALRRLGKECYLLNYNGELHGLRKKSSQRDYTMRMLQFFDHHLKGAPMPEWMAKGVPFNERDTEKEQWKGLFKTESK